MNLRKAISHKTRLNQKDANTHTHKISKIIDEKDEGDENAHSYFFHLIKLDVEENAWIENICIQHFIFLSYGYRTYFPSCSLW